MNIKQRLLLLLIILCSFSVTGQNSLSELLNRKNSGEIPYISLLELQEKRNKVLILDAREPEEYQVSHLKNATHVGYNAFKISLLDSVPKEREIVVYCSLGVRSDKIAQKLKQAGYKNVRNLYGGIFKWKNTGYPVYDINENETEKVHAYSRQWAEWLNNAEKTY